MSEQTPIQYSPLEDDERLFLMQHLVRFYDMVNSAGLEPDEDEDVDTPQVADRLLCWWRAQPEGSRPNANDLIWAVATAVGELLRAVAHVDWRRVTQDDDTYLALVADRGDTYMVLAIADSIAKRIDQPEDDAICNYLGGLGEYIEGILRSEDDPPPEPLATGLEDMDDDEVLDGTDDDRK